MVILYLKPPSHEYSINIIEKCVYLRLIFLYEILRCKNPDDYYRSLTRDVFVQNAEFLMEGGKLDNLSYFMLKYFTCKNSSLSPILNAAECALFDFRLQSCSISDDQFSGQLFYKHFKNVCDSLLKSYCLKNEISGDDLILTIRALKLFGYKNVLDFIIHRKLADFSSSNLCLPFTCALDLVAKKRVDLYKGYVILPVEQLNLVLTFVFKRLDKKISNSMIFLRNNRSIEERFRVLSEEFDVFVRNLFDPDQPMSQKLTLNPWFKISAHNIPEIANTFPPCGLHLHKKLEQKKRLKHHARIQYTLFLKEIGLPLNESIKFWAGHYSKGCNFDGKTAYCSCNHNWSKDGKRYSYNIRHLYGLEGGKRNYTAHCCRAVQSKIISLGDDSGCPFKHFDKKHLLAFLTDNYGTTDQDFKGILERVDGQNFTGACSLLLDSLKHGLGVVDLSSSQSAPNRCFDHENCREIEDLCSRDSIVSKNLISKPSDFVFFMSNFNKL